MKSRREKILDEIEDLKTWRAKFLTQKEQAKWCGWISIIAIWFFRPMAWVFIIFALLLLRVWIVSNNMQYKIWLKIKKLRREEGDIYYGKKEDN